MILDELAAFSRERVNEAQKTIPFEEMLKKAEKVAESTKENFFAFEKALSSEGLSFICEVKKASPSKGIISEDFPYMDIAKAYENGGANCISCLTEPKWFKGSDDIFRQIRSGVKIPMIRKDFTVDTYQIYEAKAMGADCVLLICAIMKEAELQRYVRVCRSLGINALVETHDEKEIEMAVNTGANIIGVNNRNLKDFSVDFENARRLRELIPKDRIFVAESGVKNEEDIAAIKALGADAVLVGEALMRSSNIKETLRKYKKAAE